IQMNRQKAKIVDIKTKIDQLEKEHSPNIKIAFKHFIRNPTDKVAAHAFECAAEQNKAMDMYRIIFATGPKEEYSTYAKQIGIGVSDFEVCMKSGKFNDKIDNDLSQGLEIGINGTPAFLIQDRLVVGLQPYGVFDKVIGMSKTD
ncbi:MAG: thioredoxin domain-containing protein, partial [Leptospirales bacterium]